MLKQWLMRGSDCRPAALDPLLRIFVFDRRSLRTFGPTEQYFIVTPVCVEIIGTIDDIGCDANVVVWHKQTSLLRTRMPAFGGTSGHGDTFNAEATLTRYRISRAWPLDH